MAKASTKTTSKNNIVEFDGQTFNLAALKRYREYQKKYTRETYKSFAIRFHNEKEADIIAFLQHISKTEGLTEYFRASIRADIKKRNFKPKKK